MNLYEITDKVLASVAVRSKACIALEHLNFGIMGSNPARGMYVCTYVRVCQCCYVLCRQRPCDGPILPSKESYQNV